MKYTVNESVKLIYIDLFAGAGGTSTGIERARHNGKKCAVVVACVNHDANAIISHKYNHPFTLHFTEDIRTLDLTSLIIHISYMRLAYPNAKLVLWASLECTNFSKAKGGLPRDGDSRTLAEHLFRYIDALDPDLVQIENVEEFMSWGPLDENGKPVSKLAGTDYTRWRDEVIEYGYNFDYGILNSADYGARTSRRRYFGIFAKEGIPIAFPSPTHSKNPKNGLKKWLPVRDVLDLEDGGNSIFDRKKSLVDKTLLRVHAGLVKFVAGGKEHFLVKYNSMGQSGKYNAPGVDEPCPVVSTQNRLGLAQINYLTKYYSGNPESMVVSLESPSPTVRTKDGLSLVDVKFFAGYYGTGDNVTSVNSPAPTITTKDRLALIKAQFIDQQFGNSKPASVDVPLGAVTINPKYSLVNCEQFFANSYSGGGQISDIEEPCSTLTVVPKQNLVTCTQQSQYLFNPQYTSKGGDINEPCFTLIARMDKTPPSIVTCSSDSSDNVPSFIKIQGDTVVYEIYASDSTATVAIKEFMALYGLLDIKMRMLNIPELKQIMGFPKDYILVGTQAEQKKFIGNAVETTMAMVLCEALVEELTELKLVA